MLALRKPCAKLVLKYPQCGDLSKRLYKIKDCESLFLIPFLV